MLACVAGHLTVATLLITACPSTLDRVDSSGYSPLFAACEYGHVHLVELLVSTHRVSINLRATVDGTSPLYIACQENQAAISARLLQCHAAPDLATPEGRTPLHAACLSASLECALLLLDAGAAINATDQRGFSPLHLCAESRNASASACADALLARGAAVTARPAGRLHGDDEEEEDGNISAAEDADDAPAARLDDHYADFACRRDDRVRSRARRSRSRSRSRSPRRSS